MRVRVCIYACASVHLCVRACVSERESMCVRGRVGASMGGWVRERLFLGVCRREYVSVRTHARSGVRVRACARARWIHSERPALGRPSVNHLNRTCCEWSQ